MGTSSTSSGCQVYIDKRLDNVQTSQKNQIWSLMVVLSGTLLGIAAKVFFIPGKP